MAGVAYAEHLAAQPEYVERALDVEVPRLDPARPLVFTGIGTSEHACQVAASWFTQLSGGAVRPSALNAHDLAMTKTVRPEDQLVVVSHRGTKRYPNEVLRIAAEAGASTVAITGQGAATPAADVIVHTCPQERASTHTMSYTAALTVLARIVAASLGADGEPLRAALVGLPDAMRRTLERGPSQSAVDGLVDSAPHPVLIAGAGLDAITAREAALKIKEGTYRWAEGLQVEFALHGTPAVFSRATPSYLIRAGEPDGGRQAELANLLRALGSRVFICADDASADLPFAATHPLTRPMVTILPFQRLVADAASALGADPDLTHLESEPWASAIGAVAL